MSTVERRRYTVTENERAAKHRKRLQSIGAKRRDAARALAQAEREGRRAALAAIDAEALTILEIAALLGIARSTIYKWTERKGAA